jgi:hypothetical protein
MQFAHRAPKRLFLALLQFKGTQRTFLHGPAEAAFPPGQTEAAPGSGAIERSPAFGPIPTARAYLTSEVQGSSRYSHRLSRTRIQRVAKAVAWVSPFA